MSSSQSCKLAAYPLPLPPGISQSSELAEGIQIARSSARINRLHLRSSDGGGPALYSCPVASSNKELISSADRVSSIVQSSGLSGSGHIGRGLLAYERQVRARLFWAVSLGALDSIALGLRLRIGLGVGRNGGNGGGGPMVLETAAAWEATEAELGPILRFVRPAKCL